MKNNATINLIVGLGNPGKQYYYNRHNIGAIFLDWLHTKLSADPWQKKNKIPALISLTPQGLILAKTTTFMNESGKAIKNLLNYYKISSSQLLVVQDDTDLLWKQYKLNFNRGSAGHKGIESIFSHIKTKKIYRLRIGVRPPNTQKIKAEYLVLQNFSSQEKKEFSKLFSEIFGILQSIIYPPPPGA